MVLLAMRCEKARHCEGMAVTEAISLGWRFEYRLLRRYTPRNDNLFHPSVPVCGSQEHPDGHKFREAVSLFILVAVLAEQHTPPFHGEVQETFCLRRMGIVTTCTGEFLAWIPWVGHTPGRVTFAGKACDDMPSVFLILVTFCAEIRGMHTDKVGPVRSVRIMAQRALPHGGRTVHVLLFFPSVNFAVVTVVAQIPNCIRFNNFHPFL